jgi:phosphatidylglycerol---prolipoprotein diacylglyceryl transferase
LIDPVIFSFDLFGITIALRWYGVLVMLGVIVAAWIAEREYSRRGENGEHIWNALIWALPVGVVGARLWYVANVTLGGNPYYMDNPGQVLNIPQGGLHFFGGLLFGAIAMIIYIRRNNLDPWLLLDVAAPVTMIGQAIARPANFINQELYGQPTTLPWGIPIESSHRIPPYNDMSLYPESTRFHPAFAYEMIWNFLAAGLLLWAARRFPRSSNPARCSVGGWCWPA